MTLATAAAQAPAGVRFRPAHVAWALLALAVLLTLLRPALPDGIVRPPEWLVWPISEGLNRFFDWLQNDVGFSVVTRGFAAAVGWLLDLASALLVPTRRGYPLPDVVCQNIGLCTGHAIPWTIFAITGFCVGTWLRSWKLGLLCGLTFVYLAVFGQWQWAMQTLSQVAVAVPLSVALGFVLGALAWRKQWFEQVLTPLLNLAQSVPHLSYLIPVVVFFGVGDHAGVIATVVFATPPMVRMTILGLRKVPPEVIESGQMCGATRWQVMRHARVPTARAEILVGVNQVIMQCLAMVVIASFIGSPGLGDKLLNYLQSLRIGSSIEIGVSIVLIAVMLDQLSRAWAEKQPVHWERGTPWHVRHRMLLVWSGLVIAALLATLAHDYAHEIPRRKAISTKDFWDAGVDHLLAWLSAPAAKVRDFLLLQVLTPIRDAFQYPPFLAVLAAVAAVGWAVGGARSALTVVLLIAFLAVSGWWDRSMITAYMVTVAVVLAVAIGLPVGVWASLPRPSRGSPGWWFNQAVRMLGILIVSAVGAAAVVFVLETVVPPTPAVEYSLFLAALAAIAYGIERYTRDVTRDRFLLFLCDTVQTFPSFIYLIPVIMLFQVNDVAAIAGVIIYGTVPMLRYTVEGMRGVPASLVEAAEMSGATRMQKLRTVSLPLALPTIMIGLNQTVMFSLMMVIIAAFIGTQDLGQEIMRAKALSDVGMSLVLGFCVAAMGLAVDHVATRWAAKRKKALGL